VIPTELQDGLEKRMVEALKELRFCNPNNEYVALNIFKQHLPKKENNNDEHLPYLLIQLLEGQQDNEDDPQKVQVIFIAGIYDEQDTFQGYRDVSTVLQKVVENLKRNPVIDKRFELNYPIRWAFHDEDTFPYYFGALETVWDIPTSIREDVEAMI
jgi:hypothetical protein